MKCIESSEYEELVKARDQRDRWASGYAQLHTAKAALDGARADFDRAADPDAKIAATERYDRAQRRLVASGQEYLDVVMHDLRQHGLTAIVQDVPLQPLAQRNYTTVATVRLDTRSQP